SAVGLIDGNTQPTRPRTGAPGFQYGRDFHSVRWDHGGSGPPRALTATLQDPDLVHSGIVDVRDRHTDQVGRGDHAPVLPPLIPPPAASEPGSVHQRLRRPTRGVPVQVTVGLGE